MIYSEDFEGVRFRVLVAVEVYESDCCTGLGKLLDTGFYFLIIIILKINKSFWIEGLTQSS